jgi:hypothetical protein
MLQLFHSVLREIHQSDENTEANGFLAVFLAVVAIRAGWDKKTAAPGPARRSGSVENLS